MPLPQMPENQHYPTGSAADEMHRLAEYYPFDEDVLAVVAEVAERHRDKDWVDLARELPEPQIYRQAEGKPVTVVDFRPQEYDQTLVYHPSMGCSIDPNSLAIMQVIAKACPDKRLIAAGNPGSFGISTGKLRFRDLTMVATGNLQPTVEPIADYLEKTTDGEEVVHVGYSFGADKAAAAVAHQLQEGALNVVQGIYAEPAAVVKRGIIQLARDFQASDKPLQDYVARANSQAYNEAREQAARESYGLPGYVLGLLRASNIAIGLALTRDGFGGRVAAGLESRPDMRVDIVSGSASEIARAVPLNKTVSDLQWQFGHDRVRHAVIKNGKHAMGNDLFLWAATIKQCLKPVAA